LYILAPTFREKKRVPDFFQGHSQGGQGQEWSHCRQAALPLWQRLEETQGAWQVVGVWLQEKLIDSKIFPGT